MTHAGCKVLTKQLVLAPTVLVGVLTKSNTTEKRMLKVLYSRTDFFISLLPLRRVERGLNIQMYGHVFSTCASSSIFCVCQTPVSNIHVDIHNDRCNTRFLRAIICKRGR